MLADMVRNEYPVVKLDTTNLEWLESFGMRLPFGWGMTADPAGLWAGVKYGILGAGALTMGGGDIFQIGGYAFLPYNKIFRMTEHDEEMTEV